ncbi:unnamed protein product [Clonostachys rhizophaga]|uniref:MARVEL domain-containing protein n=1 Tax=Clonostachys rhizophaga TaxID=160324 RepID=A0A9N9YG65_9HYPO|nr:unnamed protein product [Clonostachys rhizophaga]
MAHEKSGTTHKVLSILFRLGELISAIIVVAILGRFSWLIHPAHVSVDGRIIYTMVVASLGIVFSLLFIVPITALFLSFPFDFIMFIMWLIAFCLLETRTGTNTCTSSWFSNYWGYYWGRFWHRGPIGTGIYVSKQYGKMSKKTPVEVQKQEMAAAHGEGPRDGVPAPVAV